MKALPLAPHLGLPAAAQKRKRRPPSHRGGKPLLTREEKLERQRARARKWRAKNHEKMLKYFRDYRSAHPELTGKHARYYRANIAKWKARPHQDAAIRRARNAKKRDHVNAVHRTWIQKNRERVLAAARRSRAKHRDAKRQRDRLYRRQKPAIYKASIARAKAAKPELYKAIAVQSSLRRRSRKRALPVERVSRKRLHGRDGGRCHLCQKPIDERATFDHLIPVVRGGAYAEWNLMLAHDTCNKQRGIKQILPEETKQAAEAYVATRLAARSEAA